MTSLLQGGDGSTLWAPASSAGGSGYETLIHSETISGAASPFASITSIPQTYRELYCRIQAKSDNVASDATVVQINGDTNASSYTMAVLYGYSANPPAGGNWSSTGGGVSAYGWLAGASANACQITVPGTGSGTAPITGQIAEFRIRNYTLAQTHLVQFGGSNFQTLAQRRYQYGSGSCNFTENGGVAPITSLTGLAPLNGSGYQVGSTIELWGRGLL